MSTVPSGQSAQNEQVPIKSMHDMLSFNLASVPFDKSVEVLQDYLDKRKKAREFYKLYMEDKKYLFRYNVSLVILFVFFIPISIAIYFASLKPLALGVLFSCLYYFLCMQAQQEVEKDFRKDFPEEAKLLFDE